jgi:circadian clock protein KaiC
VNEAVQIKKLPSGVPGLDAVLGGGIPELSFNLIAGSPGCGKTAMAHQIMFALASPETPALYITILGEPPIKMLRYQQQFAFFDASKLTTCVRFLHLGAELVEGGLAGVLDRIIKEITDTHPKVVFVDSFRAAVKKSEQAGQLELQEFVQRLSLQLTGWEATTFLIGEYEADTADGNPLFTVADGIIWLSQERSRNSMVRQAKVVKMRGQGQLPGLHTMRISHEGVRIYPRLLEPETPRPASTERRGMGIPALDTMLGGGLPPGY